MSQTVTAEFSTSFTGRLVQPSDPQFDDLRRIHNGMIDKRPALIAQCRTTADIVDALGVARKVGLPLAVRGGGHNMTGRATINDGLMIDLSAMSGIHID